MHRRVGQGIASAIAAALVVTGCVVVPKPLTDFELSNLASEKLEKVVADQEPIYGAIDLYEAMARALKYNLDYRVELYEKALRAAELDLSHYQLLPKIVGNAGFRRRNNYDASSSFNLVSRTANFGASTSREKHLRERDLEISWDVLDFGLSYVRARQAADKVLIAEETKRKVVNRIIEDVRTAYWRAISADRLIFRLRRLEGRTRRALANARSLAAEQRTSPITALTYERELVEIKRAVQELQRDLSVAKTQLAALMNIKPGAQFRLRTPRRYRGGLRLKAPAKEMIWTALQNRSELREVWYRQRINMHEADIAMLELLPNFRMFANTNYNSNRFLLNNHWLGWGAKATWHLLKVVEYPARSAVIDDQHELLEQRSLALTMAIMTQVHVARVRFFHYAREVATAREYYDVQRRLVENMRVERAAGRISEQTLIREEMNTLVAEVKYDIAYAGLQNAFGNIYASMGLDPYSHDFDLDMDVKSLAGTLRSVWVVRGDNAHR